MDAEKLHDIIILQLTEAAGYLTSKELAEIAGVSVSTVKHMLPVLEEELAEIGVCLERKRGKGVRLFLTEEQRKSIEEKMRNMQKRSGLSAKKRKEYILETLLEFRPNYTIQLFSEELYVSKNVIQKDLEEISGMLKSFCLCLEVKRRSGVRVGGHEFYIRQAIILNNNEKELQKPLIEPPVGMDCRISKRAYTFWKTCYSDINCEEVLRAVLTAESELGVVFTDISLGRLVEYLAVCVRRIKKRAVISSFHKKGLKKIPEKYKRASRGIFRRLFAAQNFEKEFEILNFAARMFVAKIRNSEEYECQEIYLQEAAAFVERVGTVVLDPSISLDSRLIYEVGKALEQLSFISNYEFLSWDNLHYEIQERMSGLYGICLTNLNEIENKLQIHFAPDDIAWITLMMNQAIYRNANKLQAILVSGADKPTARYQEFKIENAIEEIEVVENLHFLDFDRKSALDKMVILAVHMRSYDENFVEVTKHISEQDILQIREKVRKTQAVRAQKMKKEEYERCLDRELVALDVNFFNREEVLAYGGKLLQEKGYANEEFIEALILREKRRSTYIGNGIAIPHVFRRGVRKSCIAVFRLRHPVLWGESEKAKVVFILAVNCVNRQSMNEIFRSFYQVISDPDRIRRIMEAENAECIIDIMKEEFGGKSQ